MFLVFKNHFQRQIKENKITGKNSLLKNIETNWNFVSVLTGVLLYSWILLSFVSTYNIAFMEYGIVLLMLKYKYAYAVTDWFRNYEQIPIIIVIYKLCCIFFYVFKIWHVPLDEVSMYNSTYLQRVFLRMVTGVTYIFNSLHVVVSEIQ